MAKILITGGAGFIGSHTADALLAAGHAVRVLDILDPQVHGNATAFPHYLDPDVECIRGDIRNVADVERALDGIDAVYHFAALTGVGQSMYCVRDYVDTNDVGTATLLEAVIERRASIRRLILASSRAVYGEGTGSCATHGDVFPEPRRREDMESGRFDVYCPDCAAALKAVPTSEERLLKPLSVYAWTKKHQEDLCQYAAKTFALPVTILRYFNVYGSRQSLQNPYTGVVSIFYSRLLENRPIALYEHGRPVRDFVHVADVVRANVAALDIDLPPGTTLNVGTGSAHTIADVAGGIAQACGRTPMLEDRGEFRVGDIHACYADLRSTSRLLGYSPRVDLAGGMREFAAWAAAQPSADRYQQTVAELERHGLFGRAKDS